MTKTSSMRRSIIAILLSFVLMMPTSLVVYADPYSSHGCQYGAISVKNYSSLYNDTWVAILNSGRAAWNNSSANVVITTTSSSNNTIEAANYSDTWYGLNIPNYNHTTGYTTEFHIKINSRTINNDATNLSNFAKSTVAHEFGHCFWLCDNPTTSALTLMKHKRNRNSITTPQSFDIMNVNAKY